MANSVVALLKIDGRTNDLDLNGSRHFRSLVCT